MLISLHAQITEINITVHSVPLATESNHITVTRLQCPLTSFLISIIASNGHLLSVSHVTVESKLMLELVAKG